jgi:rubrerythrin
VADYGLIQVGGVAVRHDVLLLGKQIVLYRSRVTVGNGEKKSARLGFQPVKQSTSEIDESESKCSQYPAPIVDEKASAKAAKDKLSAVRKQESTKAEAEQVFLKHGSRRSRSADRDGNKPKAMNSSVKRVKVDKGQATLLNSWKTSPQKDAKQSERPSPKEIKVDRKQSTSLDINDNKTRLSAKKSASITQFLSQTESPTSEPKEWSCQMCTYLNEKPLALACSICGSVRK